MNENWETRLAEIKAAGAVTGVITFTDEDGLLLSDAESERLRPKLNLVAAAAERMAYAMVKGTLKYESDDYSVDQWLEMATDDATDVTCYLPLLKEAIIRDRAGT